MDGDGYSDDAFWLCNRQAFDSPPTSYHCSHVHLFTPENPRRRIPMGYFEALRMSPGVESLKFVGSQVSDFPRVLEIVSEMEGLVTLEIEELTRTQRRHLARGFKCPATELAIVHSNLHWQGLKELVPFFEPNRHLVSLNLRGNNLISLDPLFPYFANNVNLVKLSVDENHFGRHGFEAILKNLPPNIERVRFIWDEDVGDLGDMSAMLMEAARKHESLEDIIFKPTYREFEVYVRKKWTRKVRTLVRLLWAEVLPRDLIRRLAEYMEEDKWFKKWLESDYVGFTYQEYFAEEHGMEESEDVE